MRTRTSGATEAASAPVLQIDGARATIRLNRPKHLNRLPPDDLEVLLAPVAARNNFCQFAINSAGALYDRAIHFTHVRCLACARSAP